MIEQVDANPQVFGFIIVISTPKKTEMVKHKM